MKRKCYSCKIEKDLTAFPISRSRHYGRDYKCKDCKNAYYRIKDKSPERIERSKAYHQSEKGRKVQNARERRDYHLNKHKYTAKRLVEKHLERQPCKVCGDTRSMGHHPDYAKPLDVMWLCHKHHSEEHRKIRDRGVVMDLGYY